MSGIMRNEWGNYVPPQGGGLGEPWVPPIKLIYFLIYLSDNNTNTKNI